MKSLSHVRLFVTQWTVAYQAPQSMEFSRQEYWSGSPFPSPGDLPNPGIETRSPAIQADTLPSETRDQTHVPCIGRQILNHCATRKVPARDFKLYSFEILSGYKVTCLHHLLFFSFLFFLPPHCSFIFQMAWHYFFSSVRSSFCSPVVQRS